MKSFSLYGGNSFIFLKQVAMPKSQGAITRLASASQSESEPVLCNYGIE